MSTVNAYTHEVHELLKQIAAQNKSATILDKFKANPSRTERFTFDLEAFQLDLSKTDIDETLLEAYARLARDIAFTQNRTLLLGGAHINETENRAVLHTLLRHESGDFNAALAENIVVEALAARAAFKDQISRIKARIENSDARICDLIHIGIGGSSLGTQLVYEALKPLDNDLRVHFVSNIDAHQLVEVLASCTPSSTLLFGISKTFTTAETLQNVNSVLAWMHHHGINHPKEQLYAITANAQAAIDFGVNADHVVTFPTWVGGRYSVWSSVSITAALVMGEAHFDEFLAGAAHIDQHFASAEPANNVPFIAAALDHYYGKYADARSRAIFAYDYRLRSLVPYLQQLETESNGKDRQKDGAPVDQKTSAVVWGGVGTDVQHSVFQMLHQGTDLIPSEFILIAKPDHKISGHHPSLLANGIAQTAALLLGQSAEDIKLNEPSAARDERVLNAKLFAGNRPSSTYLLDRLTPYTLGALLAFYEHRTYCFGQMVNINSFDQMGVELGKRLANDVADCLAGTKTADAFDPSTQALIKKMRGLLGS